MSPSELFALVRELPREVWPGTVFYIYVGTFGTPSESDFWKAYDMNGVPTPIIAALFTAKLVEKLGSMVPLYMSLSIDGLWLIAKTKIVDSGDFDLVDLGDGPTLLAALVAAYKAATPPG